MPFDSKAFSKTKFEPRTAEIKIPELKEFFGGDDPVFVVRGLTGIELANALDSSTTIRARAELAEALLDGTSEDRTDAIKVAFGIGNDVPNELARYHELIIRGTVIPKIPREVSVKLAETFPIDHKNLAITILNLTGQGQLAKKKPQLCSDNGELKTP